MASEWFEDLLAFLVAEPLELPGIWNLLVQPHFGKYHHRGLETLRLNEWSLSSVSSERQAVCKELCVSLWQTSRVPRLPFTSQNGSGSLVGVIDRVSIHVRQLSLR